MTNIGPESETVLVVGDIHGRAKDLLALLRGFERQGWMNPRGLLTKNTSLVFLGDYIDRGHESKKVLEVVMGLQEANPESVHSLIGNHELLALASLGLARAILTKQEYDHEYYYHHTHHGANHGWDLIRECGGLENYLREMEPEAPIGKFLRTLHPAHEAQCGDQKILCVHAGVPPATRGRECFENQVQSIRDILTNEEFEGIDPWEDPRVGENSLLWDRSIPRRHRLGAERLAKKLQVDMIAIGHTRQKQITRYAENIYATDLSGRPHLAALVFRQGEAPAEFLGDSGTIRAVASWQAQTES